MERFCVRRCFRRRRFCDVFCRGGAVVGCLSCAACCRSRGRFVRQRFKQSRGAQKMGAASVLVLATFGGRGDIGDDCHCDVGRRGIVSVFSTCFALGFFVYFGMEPANSHTRRPGRGFGRFRSRAGYSGHTFNNGDCNGGRFSFGFVYGDLSFRIRLRKNTQQNQTDNRNARRNADGCVRIFRRGNFVADIARVGRVTRRGHCRRKRARRGAGDGNAADTFCRLAFRRRARLRAGIFKAGRACFGGDPL